MFFLNRIEVDWRIHIAILLVPTLLYGILFFRKKFPATERVLLGGSYKDMLRAIISPLFLFFAFLMILSSSVEFGANQWIPALFEKTVTSLFGESAFGSILILVWISLAIAMARLFATPVVRTFSPVGVLLLSSVLAGAGIYLMSVSNGWVIFIAATIFAFGIAYFWPNMLGLVADRRPVSGALGMAILGGMGTLGGAIIQPIIGSIFDSRLQQHSDRLAAGAATIQYIIVIPVFLVENLPVNAKVCSLLVTEGNQTAIEVFNTAGKYIGRALSYAANLFNPHKIYIVSGVSDSLELLLPAIRDEFNRLTVKQCAGIEIVKTALAYDAALMGAAALAFTKF